MNFTLGGVGERGGADHTANCGAVHPTRTGEAVQLLVRGRGVVCGWLWGGGATIAMVTMWHNNVVFVCST